MSPRNSYDDVAYLSLPIRETDPLNLALVAGLHGIDAADPSDCDLLELGCGDGGNLVSLASAYPGIRAVGFDPAEVPIERGRELIRRTGITNLELHSDAAAVGQPGSADFVVAHGVLSWVNAEARGAVIDHAARAARPGALVNFSFKAFPYAHYELPAVEMANYAIELEEERAAARGEELTWLDRLRIARERVTLAATLAGQDLHNRAMRTIADRWNAMADWTLYHDDLSDPMEPFRHCDVVARAAEAGLTYVGEMVHHDLWQFRLDDRLAETIRELGGEDAARRRQIADDLTGGGFHSSLFVKGDASPELEPATRGRPLYVRQYAPGTDKGVTRSDAISAPVAQVIREHAPGAVLLSEIAEDLGRDPEVVERDLLRLYANDLVRLSFSPPPLPTPAGERPRTMPFVRAQIEDGLYFVSTRFHNAVGNDATARSVVFLLADGTRDRAAIRAELPAAAAAAGRTEHLEAIVAGLDAVIDEAAEAGLFEPA